MPNITHPKRPALFFIGYAVASIALLVYSYTQVDLNLTLSRSSLIQTMEKIFQHVGYYQRPLSSIIYVGIVSVLFVLYAGVMNAVRKHELVLSDIWKLVVLVTCIVVFSYPAAFSYDFFNYLFTAKTVLVYHQNPYIVTPLQFAGLDPWTNFMRWTHLSTAYGPFWIGLTLVPYILGFGYFVFILFNTKIMVAGFFLLASWAIVRAMDSIDRKQSALTLAIFALNPLIVVESLVSGHNDIVLMAFAVLSVWMYLQKKYWSAWWWLSVSVAAKTVTLVLIPVMFFRKNMRWLFGAMIVGLAAVLFKREFLPWYWVWIMPFVALLPDNPKITRFALVISFGLLLSYAPYLYFGDYGATEQLWKTSIQWIGVALGTVSLLFPTGSQALRR
jgi:hypothetical protein